MRPAALLQPGGGSGRARMPATSSVSTLLALTRALVGIQPVRGFEWWRVRVADGQYYYVSRGRWWGPLEPEEAAQLEAAFVWSQKWLNSSMDHGQSQLTDWDLPLRSGTGMPENGSSRAGSHTRINTGRRRSSSRTSSLQQALRPLTPGLNANLAVDEFILVASSRGTYPLTTKGP